LCTRIGVDTVIIVTLEDRAASLSRRIVTVTVSVCIPGLWDKPLIDSAIAVVVNSVARFDDLRVHSSVTVVTVVTTAHPGDEPVVVDIAGVDRDAVEGNFEAVGWDLNACAAPGWLDRPALGDDDQGAPVELSLWVHVDIDRDVIASREYGRLPGVE
jgi:hypothetical protein